MTKNVRNFFFGELMKGSEGSDQCEYSIAFESTFDRSKSSESNLEALQRVCKQQRMSQQKDFSGLIAKEEVEEEKSKNSCSHEKMVIFVLNMFFSISLAYFGSSWQ
jgi:hypothetical protein